MSVENEQEQRDRGILGINKIGRPKFQIKHNYLLAIAIDDYSDPSIPNLYNCIKDAEDFIEVLSTDYFFDKSNIHFLKSGTGRLEDEPGFAYRGEATHENIIYQLRHFAEKMESKDNLIIYFSGHGIYDEVFNEGYWIPADGELENNATYIENGTIRTALNAIDSHHTVLISDSCFSGSLFSMNSQKAVGIPRVYKHASRWGLTAGRRNQTVSDGQIGDNSPFARELIRQLKAKQEIWIGDLCKDIIEEIEKEEDQTPMGEPLSNINGHDGGQFVFLPRLATEEDHWIIAWRENTRKAYYNFLARYPDGAYEKVALEVLNTFAEGEKPQFSQEAIGAFQLMVEDEKFHKELRRKSGDEKDYGTDPVLYVRDYCIGKTRNVLNKEIQATYEFIKEHVKNLSGAYLKRLSFKTTPKTLTQETIDSYLRLKTFLPTYAESYLAHSLHLTQPKGKELKSKERYILTVEEVSSIDVFSKLQPSADFMIRNRLATFIKGKGFRPLPKLSGGDSALTIELNEMKWQSKWSVANYIDLGGPAQPLQSFEVGKVQANGAIFSPDDQSIVTWGKDKDIKQWSLEGELQQSFSGHSKGVSTVAYSKKGLISADYGGKVMLWNSSNGIGMPFSGKHKREIRSLAISKDGSLVLTGGYDRTVKLWDLTGNLLLDLPTNGGTPVNVVAFAGGDSSILLASNSHNIFMWRRGRGGDTLTKIDLFGDRPSALAVSPEGDQFAVGDVNGVLIRYQLAQIEQPIVLGSDKDQNASGEIESAAFSADGQYILTACGGADHTVRLWNLQGQIIQILESKHGAFQKASFSNDGKHILTMSYRGVVEIWENPLYSWQEITP